MYSGMVDCQVRQNLRFFSLKEAASGFCLTNIVRFITLKWIFDFSLNTLVTPLSKNKRPQSTH